MSSITIDCKNPNIAEHIMYFLGSLPKKDVKVTIIPDSADDFYSPKQKKEILKRVDEIKSGKAKLLTHEQVFADLL
jgi:hypothetical protein